MVGCSKFLIFNLKLEAMLCTECIKIVVDLEESLVELKSKTEPILIYSKKAIAMSSTAFLEIKDTVLRNGFDNQLDEITFFKEIKPKVYGKLIYYTNIFSFETKRPKSSKKIQRKYLILEQKKIQSFVIDNQEFYRYYLSNSTDLDEHYFVRQMAELRPCANSLHFLIDPNYSTCHDYTVALIIANEMLSNYFKIELDKLDSKNLNNKTYLKEDEFTITKIYWKETKVALIELLYANWIIGAICGENGRIIDIKELGNVLGKILHIDLGDVYRAFTGIKLRKKDRTKFIDYLRDRLISKMDEDDQKEP